jgi:hypothetical protein
MPSQTTSQLYMHTGASKGNASKSTQSTRKKPYHLERYLKDNAQDYRMLNVEGGHKLHAKAVEERTRRINELVSHIFLDCHQLGSIGAVLLT